MFIKKTVISAWDVIMDESKNPLRNLPIQTAHMLMQLLAWMWSTIFSLAIGSYVVSVSYTHLTLPTIYSV